MRILLLAALLLASPAFCQQWKAGTASGAWQSDSSIATGGSVLSTALAAPYSAYRWGPTKLRVPLANGRYTVRLYEREPWAAPGQRVFHVDIEGARVDPSLDVAKLAGTGNELVRTYTVDVADGALDIALIDGGPDDPMYSALDVIPVSTPPAPPTDPAVTGTARITWMAPTTCADGTPVSTCPTTGYDVEQATAAAGPFASITTRSPTQTSYDVPNLAPGTYYWRVRTLILNGVFSEPSAVVSKTIASAPTCPAQPAAEPRLAQCTAPTTGSWTQTRTYTAAPYPTCWTPGDWLPVSAPEGACVAPPPAVTWKVKAISAGTRPAYELVRSQGDTSWVRGYKLGDVSVGKPCDTAREYGTGTTEYHRVAEADVTLLSPTYKGRTLIAVCEK